MKNFLIIIIIVLSVFFLIGCINSNDTIHDNSTESDQSMDNGHNETIPLIDLSKLQGELDHGTLKKIQVNSGIIAKTIMINRSIELYGDNQTVLTIPDARVNPAIIINADMVNITGLSIENSIDDTMKDTMFLTAVEIWSSYSTLDSLFIQGFDIGVKIQGQTSNIIRNTTITNASTGIEIWDSDRNTVTTCNISNCDQSGVYIGNYATLNMVSQSYFKQCEHGVRIKLAEENTVYKNIFKSCRKPFHECCGAANNEYVFNTEE